MQISEFLDESGILVDIKVRSKKALLQELSGHVQSLTKIDQRTVFDRLLERERLGSTGIGGGIAIPHGRFAELDQLIGIFAKLDKPIDFDALDDCPVDLIFLILTPESSGSDHLQALAAVSRLFRNKELNGQLRAEGLTAPQVCGLITNAAPHVHIHAA